MNTEVLDLCTRKRPHSPDPCTQYDSLTCQYSPLSNSDSDSCDLSKPSKKSKNCRPFKAYIKDPLTLVGADNFLQKNSTEGYDDFRKRILSQVTSAASAVNQNMRRVPVNGQTRSADPSYWEKRRKNNEAAKRSRDARRAKEDEIAIRCAFLERENCHLKFVTETLKKELERMQDVMYLRNFHQSV